MGLYCGIDLHSNNHVVTVIDGSDRRVYERRLPSDLARTRAALEPFRSELVAVAIEATFNWYWLVDGLMDTGYEVRLVNTTAVQQYSGLKHTDDEHDAFWLAHLMRLGILPTGYIYPKATRGLRDLAGHCDGARFDRVLKLTVPATGTDVLPPVTLEEPNDFTNLHSSAPRLSAA